MINFPLPRIDKDEKLRELLLPYCRLKEGEIYFDTESGHKVGCFDATNEDLINQLMNDEKSALAVHDPPYNFVAFKEQDTASFIDWCRKWVDISYNIMSDNSSFYCWLGANQNLHYEPLPEFILMMKDSGFQSRSFITMRNQRGYGTQKNWMAVRQELLYYIKGNPVFNIDAEYTDIPKILNGYYKVVNGKVTENFERSKSDTIRAGNVWVDIQQVFYRMEENVNGCFAQKPLTAIERIISASSDENDIAIDFFSHSGTTLIACEKLKRKAYTIDIDPLFCEITIRRLENYRKSGKTGWQNSNPFADDIISDDKILKHLADNYEIVPPKMNLFSETNIFKK